MTADLKYLALRARSLYTSRGAAGFLTFLAQRAVRITHEIVFELDLAAADLTSLTTNGGRIVTIDRTNLQDRSRAALLAKVLVGENAIYREGLRKQDKLFLMIDDDNRVLHHTFVTYHTRYKAVLGIGDSVPLIGNCWTAPEARGRRFYPAVLRYACAALRREGHGRAIISCAQDNVASVRGIERAGFRRTRLLSSLIVASRFALQRVGKSEGRYRWRVLWLRERNGFVSDFPPN